MGTEQQFKSFTTRRFRADLHYRLKIIAAVYNTTQEIVFNQIVEMGLDALEAKYAADKAAQGTGSITP